MKLCGSDNYYTAAPHFENVSLEGDNFKKICENVFFEEILKMYVLRIEKSKEHF